MLLSFIVGHKGDVSRLPQVATMLLLLATDASAPELPRVRLLREINPGPANGASLSFAGDLRGELLFFADDSIHGVELWRSDGTTDGTALVRDLIPGRRGGIIDAAMLGDMLALSVSDGASGAQLWASDGTEAGTVLVRELAPGIASSVARLLTPAGDRLWFKVQSDFWGEKEGAEYLWSTDLKPEGTERHSKVGDWQPGFSFNADFVTSINSFAHGTLIAREVRQECCTGVSLQRYDHDGVLAAQLYAVHRANPQFVSPLYPEVSADTAYFLTAYDYQTPGCSLWRTDGEQTMSIDIGTSDCGLSVLGVVGTDLLLTRWDGGQHARIFRATPNDVALSLFADLGMGTIDQYSAISTPGGIYFIVGRLESQELWLASSSLEPPTLLRRFEHTSPGAEWISALSRANDGVFFWHDSEAGETTLWRSAGAVDSTTAVARLPQGARPGRVAEAGQQTFLTFHHDAIGGELWIVDPRPATIPHCVDCDGSAPVREHEVVAAVEIALGVKPYTDCIYVDANGDLRVSIDELVASVGEKLAGCGSAVSARATVY